MSLSDDQQLVVAAPNQNKLVVALPGSGKTHTSIELAIQILKENPDARLVMVTFTRASTAETLHRLQAKLNPSDLQRCVVQTFAKLMHDHAKPLLGKRQLIMGAPHTAFIARIAGGDPDTMQFLQHEATVEYLKAEGDVKQVSPITRKYLSELQRYNKVDLSTISVELIMAMRSGQIAPLSFTHMIVDEFQDTDYNQYSWIKAHLDDSRCFTVVGDDDQSIYGFRGSLAYHGMVMFQEDFESTGILLRRCYRCPPEVLEAAGRLIEHNQTRLDKEMISAKPKGGKVQVTEVTENAILRAKGLDPIKLDQYLDYVAQHRKAPQPIEHGYEEILNAYTKKVNAKFNGKKSAEQLRSTINLGLESHAYVAHEISKDPEGWAVLARTNMLLDAVQKELASLGLPVTRLGGKSIWEDASIVGYLALLHAMANPRNFHTLDDALFFLGVDSAMVAQIHHAAVTNKSINRIPSAGTEFGSDEGYKLFHEFNELAPIMERDSSTIAEFLNMLVERLKEHDDAHDGSTAKYRIVNDVLISNQGTIGMRIAAIHRLAQNKQEQDHNDASTVVLSTMNGSKGLQWSKVWIIDVEPGRSPAKYKGQKDDDDAELEHTEEERRLLYVAMTRAENLLQLSYRQGKRSPFINELMGYESE